MLFWLQVALRTCVVSCSDLKGFEHAVEVTAESIYEAVARALAVFRSDDWIDEIGRGLTAVKVVVRHPEIVHTVRVKDFEHWIETGGKTPAEIILKQRLREVLGK